MSKGQIIGIVLVIVVISSFLKIMIERMGWYSILVVLLLIIPVILFIVYKVRESKQTAKSFSSMCGIFNRKNIERSLDDALKTLNNELNAIKNDFKLDIQVKVYDNIFTRDDEYRLFTLVNKTKMIVINFNDFINYSIFVNDVCVFEIITNKSVVLEEIIDNFIETDTKFKIILRLSYRNKDEYFVLSNQDVIIHESSYDDDFALSYLVEALYGLKSVCQLFDNIFNKTNQLIINPNKYLGFKSDIVKTIKIGKMASILNFVYKRNFVYNIIQRLSEFMEDDNLTKICLNFIYQQKGLIYIDYLVNIDDSKLFALFLDKTTYFNFPEARFENNMLNVPINISNYVFENDTLIWNLIKKKKDCYNLEINYDDDDEFDYTDDEFDYTDDDDEEIDDFKIIPILEFVHLLVESQKIKDNLIDLQSIYFLLWELNKVYLKNLVQSIFDEYDLSWSMSIEEMLRKMYNDSSENLISKLSMIFYTKSLEKPLLLYAKEMETNIKPLLKKIENENKLQRLEQFDYNKNNLITMNEIDLMSGKEFEEFIAKLFDKMGYQTEVTKVSGDQGVDVLAFKNGYKIAIQAKCYSAIVGNHAIMEAVAGKGFYKADKCMVISNNFFTKSAKELASSNNVELWDRNVLKEKIKDL